VRFFHGARVAGGAYVAFRGFVFAALFAGSACASADILFFCGGFEFFGRDSDGKYLVTSGNNQVKVWQL
jgi:hypothetical protein